MRTSRGWLLVLAIALAGCSLLRPTQEPADMGELVVRYHDWGPEGGGGDGWLAVHRDGRAGTTRGDDFVILQLPAEDVSRLRADLAEGMGSHSGTVDTTGGETDHAQSGLTVLDPDGRVRSVAWVGEGREAWFVALTDRLGALTHRVRSEGAPDPNGPITMRMYSADQTDHLDWHSDPLRQLPWPAGVQPVIDAHEYTGADAAALRAQLGDDPSGDVEWVLPDGTVHEATWEDRPSWALPPE
jgi:hypothetical protein